MSSISRIGACLALASTFLFATMSAQAAEPLYNQVSLRAEVGQEVAHDEMQVVLYSQAQGSDPQKLASLITTRLNNAISKARAVKGVQLSLGSRNSYPLHDNKNQTLTGWRERAELRLQSRDFAALSQLTAELLGELSMADMRFSISPESRSQSEDLLLKEAIKAFNARAALVSEALGGTRFRLISLNLNSTGFQPPMPMRTASMKGMAMADAAPTLDIEAGSSQVIVTADGVIEVILP